MVALCQTADDPFAAAEPTACLEQQQIGSIVKDVCAQHEGFRF
jgi:hypothetical protein